MFGDMIKNLRQSRSLNQVQLAVSLNVSKQTVSNWENNNILPSIEMLVKISQFFSVSTDYLLELDSRSYIEVTGLTDVQLAHVRQIIDDINQGDISGYFFMRPFSNTSMAYSYPLINALS